jgi:hypothetical protein
MTPSQRRQLLYTTSMQDQKYQASVHALSRVQGDLSRLQAHAYGIGDVELGVKDRFIHEGSDVR